MKTASSPFVRVDGEPYVIANFTLDDAFGFPSIKQLLNDLLEQYQGSDILILRKLKTKEAKRLERSTRDSEHEAWARIAAKFERRKK
jgi:hypothetical protein